MGLFDKKTSSSSSGKNMFSKKDTSSSSSESSPKKTGLFAKKSDSTTKTTIGGLKKTSLLSKNDKEKETEESKTQSNINYTPKTPFKDLEEEHQKIVINLEKIIHKNRFDIVNLQKFEFDNLNALPSKIEEVEYSLNQLNSLIDQHQHIAVNLGNKIHCVKEETNNSKKFLKETQNERSKAPKPSKYFFELSNDLILKKKEFELNLKILEDKMKDENAQENLTELFVGSMSAQNKILSNIATMMTKEQERFEKVKDAYIKHKSKHTEHPDSLHFITKEDLFASKFLYGNKNAEASSLNSSGSTSTTSGSSSTQRKFSLNSKSESTSAESDSKTKSPSSRNIFKKII
eukprot:TRINITY_DN3191_c4_g9_i1.p1 TRINITY_DN3191_c4_g9~~TRINITY_DN3191_c4_g9_i1.p1  ORF type:complete len:355 (-),score=112.36 TRINITY_DN3191_c4_g9_i1:356-1393(-)